MNLKKDKINFEEIQKKFYETTWKNTNLGHRHKPGIPGWKSYIPNSFFVKFLGKSTVPPGSKMLDLGCGAGRHTVYAAKKGFKAYGIDFSVDAIKKSKAYAKNLHLEHLTKFLVSDVKSLPFKDDYFDFINDSGCFNHLPLKDWKIYAAEVYRVLKHEGIYRLKAASYKARAVWGYSPLTKNRWILQTNGQYKYYFKKEELEQIFKKFKMIKLSDRFVSRKNRFYFMVAKKE